MPSGFDSESTYSDSKKSRDDAERDLGEAPESNNDEVDVAAIAYFVEASGRVVPVDIHPDEQPISRIGSVYYQRIERYPAATAIGQRMAPGLLQVYALCATQSGEALENPRQVSAWRYPREYGPTPPSFARAMRLPNGGLAISGTAAVVGHASCHDRDLQAQVAETCTNLRTLLDRAELADFDTASPLKIYLRHAEDAAAVQSALSERLDPEVPQLILQGDICRRELLVEIDGWSGLPC